jgi:Na+/proline symporter/nitrogen-specific signal transduction histidine kinase
MSTWVIIVTGLAYLAILFGVANYAQHTILHKRNIINHPMVYALSMGVYCTAWTFYGSVGRAAASGIDFIAVFIGPTLILCLGWPLWAKILRICKVLRITSLADFISTRYGKNFSVGICVALLCVFALVPYISLQIKAIVDSIKVLQLSSNSHVVTQQSVVLIAVIVTIILFLFTVVYGGRSADTAEKHPGLIAAIAFESLIKLAAFLAVGIYVTFGLFNGFGDIFSKATANNSQLFTLQPGNNYIGWMLLTTVAMLALLFLPRQFHVAIVENQQERHLKTASWLFPLYLLLINLFVLPIALAGNILLKKNGISADSYVLALPLLKGSYVLAMFTWIGGVSAATGMIIIESIALSIMISNNLVIPLLVSKSRFTQSSTTKLPARILLIRRLSIAVVLGLALLYYLFLGKTELLISMGLISFCAVAQFAPAIIGGIFWKRGSKAGALTGMIAGFIIWVFTLVVPGLVNSGFLPASVMQQGLFGFAFLHPHHLLGLHGLDPIAHGFFWSILVNLGLYITVSVNTRQHPQEVYQAELFINIEKHDSLQHHVWNGTANTKELLALLSHFIGDKRAANLIQAYAARHKIDIAKSQLADARMVNFTERVLGSVTGTASAHILVQSITKHEEISMDEVLNILRENQQTIEVNKELRKKSLELSKATQQLQHANEQLRLLDKQKDEFLYTVTHELRTPLTSIRALSEIVYDNPDMPLQQQQQYLEMVIRETERLAHLITQVLTLEKFESGTWQLQPETININALITSVADSMMGLVHERSLQMHFQKPDYPLMICCDGNLIRQVLVNLLGNAVKFAATSITVQVKVTPQLFTCMIADDGNGIDPGQHDLIFDKFFQATNHALKKPQGSGLGLAICKKIIALHRGSIYVQSQPGAGAKFTFTLPYIG